MAGTSQLNGCVHFTPSSVLLKNTKLHCAVYPADVTHEAPAPCPFAWNPRRDRLHLLQVLVPPRLPRFAAVPRRQVPQRPAAAGNGPARRRGDLVDVPAQQAQGHGAGAPHSACSGWVTRRSC
ncbi:hypothetical protein G6F68_019363 [Rhizopus microsporus]|nr:hypothetical protein G6F68_019363 [Rhizopus microsporus]